ncbi:MAG TPA: FAD-dependent oxidoreductase [Pseudonocardiaceae bacterium]
MNDIDTDVAVVGAGIVGCLVARELARRSPAVSVRVLERTIAGSGASRHSAGVHFPRGRTRRVREMSSYSQSYYEALLAEQPTLPIYPVRMSVHSSNADSQHVRDSYLDRAHLVGVGRTPAGTTCVWHGAGSHYADVSMLVTALTRRLPESVRCYEGVGVTSVEQDDDGVTLGLSTGRALHAGAVVLAPGPWLRARAWAALLAPFAARVKKVVALHIDRRPDSDDRLTVFEDDDSFLLPMAPSGRWLFSHTNQDWDVDPDEIRGGLSARDLATARDCLAEHAPAMVDRVAGGRVFCDAYSRAGEPIVSTVDGSRRVVFAGAANGSGYRLAPAMAAQAVDLLTPVSGRRIIG